REPRPAERLAPVEHDGDGLPSWRGWSSRGRVRSRVGTRRRTGAWGWHGRLGHGYGRLRGAFVPNAPTGAFVEDVVRLHLHLVSDSTGETVTTVARAGVSQFDGVVPVEHVWSFVRTRAQV